MVGHDDVGVEEEALLVAVTKESCDHEFGVRCALEETPAGVGIDGNGIGLGFEAHGL